MQSGSAGAAAESWLQEIVGTGPTNVQLENTSGLHFSGQTLGSCTSFMAEMGSPARTSEALYEVHPPSTNVCACAVGETASADPRTRMQVARKRVRGSKRTARLRMAPRAPPKSERRVRSRVVSELSRLAMVGRLTSFERCKQTTVATQTPDTGQTMMATPEHAGLSLHAAATLMS